MQIGVALAGGGDDLHTFCQDYGEPFGMAFQIQDDLFDVTSSEGMLHKPVLNDIRSGEHTFFTNYIFTKGTPEQKKVLRRYFGSTMTAAEEDVVRTLFQESGALDYGKNLMNDYFDKAEKSVLQLPKQSQEPWLELIVRMKQRTS
jgi:geranylgeranyl pyrophosphate synthase